MFQLAGKKVKIYLRNDAVLEGVVEEWGPDMASMKNTRGDWLIINNPSQDVMLIEVAASNFQDEEDFAYPLAPEYEDDDPYLDAPKKMRQEAHSQRAVIGRVMKNIKGQVLHPEDKYEFPNFSQRIPHVRSSAKNR